MDRPSSVEPGRASLSPEYGMLLACARSRMDERQALAVRELSRRVSWEALFALGRRHSLFPLLYRQLAAAAPREVPPAALDRLKGLYQANAARNLLLMGELRRVLRALTEDGVTGIPFKGPLLAAGGYGDLSLRRFVDLDVIVRRDDVERAIATLARLGYRAELAASPAQQAFLVRTQHALSFRRDGGKLIVELHWAVASERFATGQSAESLWERAAMVRVDGIEVLALAPEDTLLSLCVHGSKHLWERLAWVCDIAEWVAAHPALRWPELLARAERAGQLRMLLVGLRLAAGLLDAELPGPASAAIREDRAVARLAIQAMRVIFRDPPRPPGMVASMRFNLLARSSRRARWGYLLHVLTPTDADVLLIRLPRAMQFVYFLVRPFRLLSRKDPVH
ncbi:MAG: nucleotidyltransferase domain-containing protein [Thermoanaerobaculia bacterium]